MFGKMQVIIVVTKDKLFGTLVKDKKRIVKSVEIGWSPATLETALAKIKKDLKAQKVRILFGDDVSYVLKIEVPTDIEKGKEKEFIAQKISEQIPEVLGSEDWDYKELSFSIKAETPKEGALKEVIVFSPVKVVFKEISQALFGVGLEVEAIEPAEVAKTRDINPIIGLALKDDIKGEDKEVLNLKPIEKEGIGEEEILEDLAHEEEVVGKDEKKAKEAEVTGNQERSKKFWAIILIIVILLIWVLASAYFFYFSKSFRKSKDVGDAGKLAEEQSFPLIAQSPTPTSVELNLSDYKIQVQNGTGLKGEADFASDLLQSIGFENIETANASSSGHVQTELEINEGTPLGVFEKIKEALQDSYNISSSSALLDNFDVVVILGKRK